MNILLIGGNGFVGKALLKQASLNKIKLSYLSRTKISSNEFSNINWIKGDIFDIEHINISEQFDVAIHLIGTIKNKQLYTKLNTNSVRKSIELCSKFNIKKLVYFSAQGGFKDYYNSKITAEKFIHDSNLNYLIVKPGLMYGSDRLSSYFNVIPIKFFATLGIPFFKNVYPLSVDLVANRVINTIIYSPPTTSLTIKDLK